MAACWILMLANEKINLKEKQNKTQFFLRGNPFCLEREKTTGLSQQSNPLNTGKLLEKWVYVFTIQKEKKKALGGVDFNVWKGWFS